MDFSSILLRNTRLMAVLRNLFAFLASVDVVYCQHARKSYQTSTETRCQLWDHRGEDKRRIHTRTQSSTGKYIIQKYHFCHHFMVNITFNPTINLFYFYAPPMGHSFNPLLHQPLIPPLDQQMSCHFTDFHPSQINRFHLPGYAVILYLGTSDKKKSITVAWQGNFNNLKQQKFNPCQLDLNFLS